MTTEKALAIAVYALKVRQNTWLDTRLHPRANPEPVSWQYEDVGRAPIVTAYFDSAARQAAIDVLTEIDTWREPLPAHMQKPAHWLVRLWRGVNHGIPSRSR